MKQGLLKVFRALSLLWAVAALLVTPAIVRSGSYSLFVVIPGFLLAACPIIFLDSVSVGTRYRLWRIPDLYALGVSQRWRTALHWFSTLVIAPAVLGWALTRWSKSPPWLSVAYQQGFWLGPVLAVLLLQSAAGYHTGLFLLNGGRIKRCSSGHRFTPFARACPECGSKRHLELVDGRVDS